MLLNRKSAGWKKKVIPRWNLLKGNNSTILFVIVTWLIWTNQSPGFSRQKGHMTELTNRRIAFLDLDLCQQEGKMEV